MGIHSKNADGKYHIKGKTFELLIGTRAQVWHETAYKTSGGLRKMDLVQNDKGRIVSKSKYLTAKKENRLLKHGYGTEKGKFGAVRVAVKSKKIRKSRKTGGAILLGGYDDEDDVRRGGAILLGGNDDIVEKTNVVDLVKDPKADNGVVNGAVVVETQKAVVNEADVNPTVEAVNKETKEVENPKVEAVVGGKKRGGAILLGGKSKKRGGAILLGGKSKKRGGAILL